MEENITDTELLRRYGKERSEAAFTELVRRHLGLVYAAALRRLGGDAHSAADVAQQVFTALARDATKLSCHPALAAWLYTATRHAALDVIRAERRRKTREQEAHLMNELVSSVTSVPDWERLRPVLDEAMDELGDGDRTAVLLRFFAGRPFAEIGVALDVTEDAARMRVDRAMDKLRALLAKRQITSTTAALAVALANQPAVAMPSGLATTVTSTAMASGSAVGFLGFMSTTKLGLGVASVLALLLTLGVATYERQAHNEAEQSLATSQRNYEAHMASLHETEHRAEAAEQAVARLQKELDATLLAVRQAEEATAAAQAAAAWDPLAEGRAFLARHPEVKQALDDYASASRRFQFAPMYRALGLTPEQIRRWEALGGGTMGARLTEGRSFSMPFGFYGSPPSGSDYSKVLQDILGDDGMKQLRKFQDMAATRGLAADVAGSLYFTETPLRPDQADQLVQVLMDNRNTGPAARSSAYDWNAVIAKAGAILSPQQVAVLAGKRATDLFQKALNRPRNDAPPPSAAPANPSK